MPGLVETHWHMVEHALPQRFAGDRPERVLPDGRALGQQMNAEDIFQSTRLSAAEAINSGMTFVHSWCHNVRSAAHAQADIRALAEVGIRARHSCGWPQGLPDTQTADQGPIESLAKDWKSLVQRGPHYARRGMARPVPCRPDQAWRCTGRNSTMPASSGADHGACRERSQGRGPDRAAL